VIAAPRQTASGRRSLTLPAQICLVVLAYYLVPVREPVDQNWLRAAASLVVFVLAVGWIARQVLRETRGDTPAVRADRLVLVAVSGVVFFALADLAVARTVPGQFTGLATKTDGLYFALTTLATIGFGDVHAEGQLARALLIVQMVFNIVVVARAAHVLSGMAAERARARRPPT
jgi:uncharacterized membrane protein